MSLTGPFFQIAGGFICLVFITLLSGPVQATEITLSTPLGDVDIELFDEEAPRTVANFLNYVNDGDYRNSFIHRSVPNFVIQGGGLSLIHI